MTSSAKRMRPKGVEPYADSLHVPHIILVTGPHASQYLAWVNGELTITDALAMAFVFPSATLAMRWAEAIFEDADAICSLQPAPQNTSSVVGEPYCSLCGCIDTFGCPQGCYWAAPGLCSICADHLELQLTQAHDAWQTKSPGSVGTASFSDEVAQHAACCAFNAEMDRTRDCDLASDKHAALVDAVLTIAERIAPGGVRL